jgi:hypothetical protein
MRLRLTNIQVKTARFAGSHIIFPPRHSFVGERPILGDSMSNYPVGSPIRIASAIRPVWQPIIGRVELWRRRLVAPARVSVASRSIEFSRSRGIRCDNHAKCRNKQPEHTPLQCTLMISSFARTPEMLFEQAQSCFIPLELKPHPANTKPRSCERHSFSSSI